jgi:asparagine N-glycosylation enzyme membrane subunit Stt3
LLTGEVWANWNVISIFVIYLPAIYIFITYRKKKGLDYLNATATIIFVVVMMTLFNILPLWFTDMDLNGKLMITFVAICFFPIGYIGLKRHFKLVKKLNNIE